MSRRLFFGVPLLLAFSMSGLLPESALAEPRRLTPSTPWPVDYADDNCPLARTFGEEGESITLVLRRFEPNSFFGITLVGRHFRRARLGEKAVLRLGPQETEQQAAYFSR